MKQWICGLAALLSTALVQADETDTPDSSSMQVFAAGLDWVRLNFDEELFRVQLMGGGGPKQIRIGILIAEPVLTASEEHLILGTLIKEKPAGSERQLVNRSDLLLYVP